MTAVSPIEPISCDSVDVRQRMTALGMEFMTGRLGFDNAEIAALTALAAEPARPWIEYAHTPHLFHLGTARVMREAARQAEAAGGQFVFFLNDHLPARELGESRYLPLSADGWTLANPPAFGLTAAQGKHGMHRVPSPSGDTMAAFAARWAELDPSNKSEIGIIGEQLLRVAACVRDHAAFLCRVMLDLTRTLPLCVPTSALMAALPEWSVRMNESGRLWAQCASCGYRLGRAASAPQSPCPSCGDCRPAELIADVIARQSVANACGLALRVCGRHKPYQDEADSLSQRFGVQPPPRLRVTGAVRMRDASGRLTDRVNLLQWVANRGSPVLLDGADVAADVIVESPSAA